MERTLTLNQGRSLNFVSGRASKSHTHSKSSPRSSQRMVKPKQRVDKNILFYVRILLRSTSS